MARTVCGWRLAALVRLASAGVGALALSTACGSGGLGGTPYGQAGAGAVSAVGGGDTATGGTSGSGHCEPGAVGCPCYANQTCNGGLDCVRSVCTGQASGGGSGAGGSPGTGGTTATGGAANPTGGTTTGGVATGGLPSGGSATSTGGADTRYTNGPWAGYVWTAVSGTGSTISPTNFDAHTPGTAFCASGTVGPMTDYSGVGIIGYNINQAQGSTVLGTFTPSSTAGIKVTFTNPGGSVLRLQIQGPNGSTDEKDRWCYPLTGSSGTITIPWTSFNTYCWGGSGTTYYSGQALQAVMLLVPGDAKSAVSFSICLSAIGPA
jgi:hypothetical protein